MAAQLIRGMAARPNSTHPPSLKICYLCNLRTRFLKRVKQNIVEPAFLCIFKSSKSNSREAEKQLVQMSLRSSELIRCSDRQAEVVCIALPIRIKIQQWKLQHKIS